MKTQGNFIQFNQIKFSHIPPLKRQESKPQHGICYTCNHEVEIDLKKKKKVNNAIEK